MPERPPIRALGRIVKEHRSDHLYEVEMANGYSAYAIVERRGPKPAESGLGSALDATVQVEFSPFDMSRCKIAAWLPPA